mmetsp:Transcript_61820/g.179330  ORF Transcript_61820/g.179330 Transcript_61820/m.179330 type:complete len:209 (+) Transcript_61820:677-1303(+)
MDNVLVVHVAHRAQNLLDDDSGLILGQVPLRNDFVEQFPAPAQLHHDVERPFIFVGIEQPYDVRVVQVLHDLDFLHERLQLRMPHRCLRNLLHSPHDPVRFARRQVHHALGALALLLACVNIVVLFDLTVPVLNERRTLHRQPWRPRFDGGLAGLLVIALLRRGVGERMPYRNRLRGLCVPPAFVAHSFRTELDAGANASNVGRSLEA